jgi:hypothetical protein
MASSPSDSQDIQRLTKQVRDLENQASLLQRKNECLCRENTDLQQGRNALMIRLQLLEEALEIYQQSSDKDVSCDRSTQELTDLTSNLLPEADRWLLKTSQADYATLKNFLANQDWEAADRETQHLMLQISGLEAQQIGFLNAEHIEAFPCLDLKIINKLWTIYSNGKYGFMVQREIWSRTHSTRNLWHSPEFEGYYPKREGLGHSLAQRLLRCALDDF